MAATPDHNCLATKGYYPVDKKHGCDDKSWVIKERIGEKSLYGTIWEACCNNDCSYVMKYQKIGEVDLQDLGKENISKEQIINEIKIQIELSSLNVKNKLAVPIVDAWYCDEGAIIVMRKLNETAKHLIIKYKNDDVTLKIFWMCFSMINALHLNGYYHGDAHLDNFMVRYSNSDENEAQGIQDSVRKYDAYNYKYYFIDFGKSGKLEGEGRNRRDNIIDDYVKLMSYFNKLYDDGIIPDNLYRFMVNIVINYTKELNTRI